MDTDPNENVPVKRPTPPVPPPPVPPKAAAIKRLPATPTPPAAPAPTPTPTPEPPTPPALQAAATVDTNSVVVRTMRDDIASAKQGNFPPQQSTPATPARAVVASPTPTTTQLPLPPRPAATTGKTISAPSLPRKRRRGLIGVLVAILVLVLIGAGGAAAWFFWLQDLVPGATPAPVVAQVEQILPSEYLLVASYQLQSAADRTQLTNIWNTSRGGNAGVAELLTGDPRLLLNSPEVTQFYYVLLEDSSDPFLVVPINATTTEHVVGSGRARYVERDGWYVAHPVTIDPYVTALNQRTLASVGAPALLTDSTAVAPLRFSVSAGLLPTLRTNLAGQSFLAGQLQEVTVAASVDARQNVLQLSGIAVRFNPLAGQPTNQQLLSMLPPAATTVRLGANFKEDVSSWLSLASVLDDNTLQRPVVKQLLDQLAGPYAWFQFPNASGTPATGLIIELPPALRGKLTTSEPALEQAVPALTPLVVDRRTVAPISFTEVPYGTALLRFANLIGTNQALDYAVVEQHILIATSKDSMFALLDTVAGTRPSLETNDPWAALLAQWGALPAASDVILGTITVPSVLNLLPTAATIPVRLGVAFSTPPGSAPSTTVVASGVLGLTASSLTPSPAGGPTPSIPVSP